MAHSSKKLQDADILADEYQASFGGKYSTGMFGNFSDSLSSINLKGIWDLIVLSRVRLGILFAISFFLSMIILIKSKAGFVMTKKISIDIPQKIDKINLIKYSFIFGFILSIIVFALSYKFPFIKKILFKEEDCELCQA